MKQAIWIAYLQTIAALCWVVVGLNLAAMYPPNLTYDASWLKVGVAAALGAMFAQWARKSHAINPSEPR